MQLTAPRKIELAEIPIPEPHPGNVRVCMKAIGICGTDLHLFHGGRPDTPYPLTIGHEGVGTIDAVGDGISPDRIGNTIVIEPNYPCQQCHMCLGGRGNVCINKRIVGLLETGCFADYFIMPSQFAWDIPDGVDHDDAVFIEPAAVAYHGLANSNTFPGDTIAVVGLGTIGILLTHIALNLGYQVIAMNRSPEKVDMAEKMGAIGIVAEGDDLTERTAKIWQEAGVTAVFECSGSAQVTTLCVTAAPTGANVVILGLSGKPAEFTSLYTTRGGINIIGSMIYDHPADFRRTINLLKSGVLRPSQFITGRVPLTDLQSGIERASKGKDIKIIVEV